MDHKAHYEPLDRLVFAVYNKRDKQNLYRAKVERQISIAEITQQDQHQIFCHLLGKDVYAQHTQCKFLLVRRKLAKEPAGGNTKDQTCQKPKNMGKTVGKLMGYVGRSKWLLLVVTSVTRSSLPV